MLGTPGSTENVQPLRDAEATFCRADRETREEVGETPSTITAFLVTLFCSRYVNVGLFYLRQLFFAKFDLKVHTDKGKLTDRLIASA